MSSIGTATQFGKGPFFVMLGFLVVLPLSPSMALGDVNGDTKVDAVFANQNQPNRVCLGDGAGGFTCSDVSSDTNDSLEGMGSSLLLAHVPTSFHICCNGRPHSPRFTIW